MYFSRYFASDFTIFSDLWEELIYVEVLAHLNGVCFLEIMTTFRSLRLWLFDVKRKPFSPCLLAVFRFLSTSVSYFLKSEIIEIEWTNFHSSSFTFPFL